MFTYFSIDVETSGLTTSTGVLLTIGVQPVSYDSEPKLVNVPFYIRIDQSEYLSISRAGGCWGNPDDTVTAFKWWSEQRDDIRGEAYEDDSLERHDERKATELFLEYIRFVEPDPKRRIFVANPSTFDRMWIDHLIAKHMMEHPFDYRSLCLRSMRHGLRPHNVWGKDRDFRSRYPHHAYWDALSQAEDLIDMLTQRDAPK